MNENQAEEDNSQPEGMSSDDNSEDEILDQLSLGTGVRPGNHDKKSRGKLQMINKRMDELIEVLD